MVQAKESEVKYVDTEHQVADVFTKSSQDFNNGFKNFSRVLHGEISLCISSSTLPELSTGGDVTTSVDNPTI